MSDLDRQLSACNIVKDEQYWIYGNNGYSLRKYFDVPFQGTSLDAPHISFSMHMNEAWSKVEEYVKEV